MPLHSKIKVRVTERFVRAGIRERRSRPPKVPERKVALVAIVSGGHGVANSRVPGEGEEDEECQRRGGLLIGFWLCELRNPAELSRRGSSRRAGFFEVRAWDWAGSAAPPLNLPVKTGTGTG